MKIRENPIHSYYFPIGSQFLLYFPIFFDRFRNDQHVSVGVPAPGTWHLAPLAQGPGNTVDGNKSASKDSSNKEYKEMSAGCVELF